MSFHATDLYNVYVQSSSYMTLHLAKPLPIAYVTTIYIGLGSLNLTLTLTGQQLRNVTPCSVNAALLI